MNRTFEELWDAYFCEACARIETDEERALSKKAAALYHQMIDFLTPEQQKVMEQYVEACCDAEALMIKKAFFKGVEFASGNK